MKLRIYIDTSVIGGCVDEEFQEASLALINMAKHGEVILVVSSHLAEEVAEAPPQVKEVFSALPADSVERVSVTDEAVALQNAYLAVGVLPPSRENDALHVAIATVARADLIVSWNFRHIVHLDKIRRFNAVNMLQGYPTIEIRSPREVV